MFEALKCNCEVIKNFSPAWFASVMGTGILAVTTFFYSTYIPFLKTIAKFIAYLNVFLFFVLLIPWLARWIFFRKEVLADLENPITSNFFATLAVGMLVLASDFILILNNSLVGFAFWSIGAILTIFFAILTPYIMFKGEHVKIDHINPAWFIPPVGLIVIPIAGSLFISYYSGILKQIIIITNFFSWGAGFFIYLALLAITVYRFILHHPLPSALAPTIWINLGPIGAGTVALINLIKNANFVTLKEPFFMFGFLFWGFGIWWLIIAILMTLHYLKSLKLPFAMSWWAFTFPLGAYVAASHLIAKIFGFTLVDYIGFTLYWLLVFLWGITFIQTLIKAYKGVLFVKR